MNCRLQSGICLLKPGSVCAGTSASTVMTSLILPVWTAPEPYSSIDLQSPRVVKMPTVFSDGIGSCRHDSIGSHKWRHNWFGTIVVGNTSPNIDWVNNLLPGGIKPLTPPVWTYRKQDLQTQNNMHFQQGGRNTNLKNILGNNEIEMIFMPSRQRVCIGLGNGLVPSRRPAVTWTSNDQVNYSSPLDKMADISQTIFSNAYSWMKRFAFWLNFHWSLFPGAQLTITQQWFR